ncbi:MAG: hypothetical protein IT233_01080 [Bacteroidia bacterium]|nr:hypothetical protein [Bacteroidia bacterium]
MKIESQVVDIENSQENVFVFLSDFSNFGKMMPPQVTDWKASADECSFVINGMATIGMKITERVPNERISIVSHGGKIPFSFTLNAVISANGSHSRGQLIFESDMNPMMRMMVEKPLSNFFNILASKMKEIR